MRGERGSLDRGRKIRENKERGEQVSRSGSGKRRQSLKEVLLPAGTEHGVKGRAQQGNEEKGMREKEAIKEGEPLSGGWHGKVRNWERRGLSRWTCGDQRRGGNL